MCRRLIGWESVAIIFVAPVAAAEMGTRFATGFRE